MDVFKISSITAFELAQQTKKTRSYQKLYRVQLEIFAESGSERDLIAAAQTLNHVESNQELLDFMTESILLAGEEVTNG